MIMFSIKNINTFVNFNTADKAEAIDAQTIIDDVCSFNHTEFMYRWVCLDCNGVCEYQKQAGKGVLYCQACNAYKVWNREAKKKPRPMYHKLKYFKNQKFPSGLASRVFKALKVKDIPFNWVDLRETPIIQASIEHTKKYPLRYYQEEASDLAIKQTRGILHVPTRGGKTLIASNIIFKLGMQTLIIVPNLEVLWQTYKMLKEAVHDKSLIGVIGDLKEDINYINVATIQTLHSKKDSMYIQQMLLYTNVLIIDEAHHINIDKDINSNTWLDTCNNIPAYYRIGLTGTPGTPKSLERSLLESVTGKIIYHIPITKLVEEGYIAQPKVEFHEFDHKRTEYGSEWKKANKSGIVENSRRNGLVAHLAQEYSKDNSNVLVVCQQTMQASNILKFLPDALYLDGRSNTKKREDYIKKFENRENLILVTTLFKEGTDLQFDTIIIANSGKKEKTTIQRSARVLTGGKEVGRIVDIYDTNGGILEKHSKARERIYKSQGFPITKHSQE